MALPVYYENISVVSDNNLLDPYITKILENPPRMANKNSAREAFFVIDDHLFMIVDTDHPYKNAENWVPYYSQFVSGFFVSCPRYSTSYIFDNCEVPVFCLGISPDIMIPASFLEHDAHSISVTCEKTISVFFQGRFSTRIRRKDFGELINKEIANSHIRNSGTHPLSGIEYVKEMCKAKIAWCPRSHSSPPDHDCNSVPSKEGDAMCLELLVVKQSIGQPEVEKRIPGVHFVQYNNDGSDLIEKLRYYLEHEDERKEIAHNGRLWWERNCSTFSRAKGIFDSCFKAIYGGNSDESIECYMHKPRIIL